MAGTTQLAEKIVLSGSEPIARGAVRDVWNRPGHPDQILKTIRASKREKYAARKGVRHWLDTVRLGPYRTFRIEYDCYLKTAFKCAQANRAIPIAEIGGLVLTDHGLAQVCEKVVGSDGALAPTFAEVVAQGPLSDQQVAWFSDFMARMLELNVNAPDLSGANVVLDEAQGRFVLIDGFGDKTLIAIRAGIKPLNQAQLMAGFSAMAALGGLDFDPQTNRIGAAHAE